MLRGFDSQQDDYTKLAACNDGPRYSARRGVAATCKPLPACASSGEVLSLALTLT